MSPHFSHHKTPWHEHGHDYTDFIDKEPEDQGG